MKKQYLLFPFMALAFSFSALADQATLDIFLSRFGNSTLNLKSDQAMKEHLQIDHDGKVTYKEVKQVEENEEKMSDMTVCQFKTHGTLADVIEIQNPNQIPNRETVYTLSVKLDRLEEVSETDYCKQFIKKENSNREKMVNYYHLTVTTDGEYYLH